MDEALQIICRKCQRGYPDSYFFCPNCGKKLQDKSQDVSFFPVVKLFLISLLLPPLGIWPAIKYFKNKQNSAKVVSIIAIILNILSLYLTWQIFISLQKSVNDKLNSQMKQLENLGY